MLHALNPSTTRVQIANNVAHVFFRNNHFDRHHRLQQHGRSLARGFFERHRTGNLECHFVRIDFVIAAIVENGLHIDHLIAGKNAAFHRLTNPLIDGLDVFLRHHAANDVIHKFVSRTRLLRLQTNLDVAIWTAAARLPDVLTFRFGVLANGLAIRHLRLADIGLNGELPHHAINNYLEMQFAHAADDGLTAVWVSMNFEGRIFLGQFRKRHAHFFLIALGLWLDRHRDYRCREFNRLQENRVLFVANRVTGSDVLQSNACANVAGVNFADFFALVGVHLEQTANALGAPFGGAVNRIARLKLSGVNPNKRQLAHVGVSHDLECERRKRLFIVCFASNSFVCIGICSLYWRDVTRRRQKIHHRIEQRLYAFELVFLSDGKLNRYRAGIEAFADGVDGVFEIGAHLIHLINEANSRDFVLIGLAPYGF